MVLILYVRSDDGIYGSSATECEPVFTHAMLNLPTPSQSEKPPPPKITTSEFQFQQTNRRSVEQTGKSIDQHIQTGLDEEYYDTRSTDHTHLTDGVVLGHRHRPRFDSSACRFPLTSAPTTAQPLGCDPAMGGMGDDCFPELDHVPEYSTYANRFHCD